jgi:hypothetical protein
LAIRHESKVVPFFALSLMTGFLLTNYSAAAQGAIIWNGPVIAFTNTTVADVDKLVSDVWLTRASKKGLFNTAPGIESSYQTGISPAGTQWALGQLANYATLTYSDWATCYGGGGFLINNIVGTNAVVHLINSDIYLSIQFTAFSSGGGFSYIRSTPVGTPEPSTAALLLVGTILLARVRSKI